MSSILPRMLFSQRTVPHTIIRQASSKAAKSVNSGPPLSDVKLRALVSLYHQAENYVTPENLNQKIEEAFLPDLTNPDIGPWDPKRLGAGISKITVDDLWELEENRRIAPKMALWDHTLNDPSSFVENGWTWSSKMPKRETKVIEALYGVDMSQGGVRQPGLDILEGANEDLISVERAEELTTQREMEAKLRREEGEER